ncbi:MAG: glutathione peroxidase [Flavobacterium sp.]
MKKVSLLICILVILISNVGCAQSTEKHKDTKNNSKSVKMKKSFYDFKVDDISGNNFDFASLKGKKVMIVNTASECGNTPQYKFLEDLYQKYKAKDFIIIGFPANDFGQQEPGSNQEIMAFCKKNYGVTFPMMSKITVKGSEMNEVYQFLTQKSLNDFQDSEVKWNFQKYLIGKDGKLEKIIAHKTSPMDPEVINWIEN